MVKLIDVLRAKSRDQENYLLKEHLKEAVKRTLQLHEFIGENKDSFNYNIVKNDGIFEKLVIATILHDLGKIDYSFQKKVFDRDERKSSGDWEKVKTFLKPLNNPEIRYPRHEILSTIWSTFLMENTKLDSAMRTAILLHHYNEYFIAEKDLMEIVFNYRKSIASYLKFISTNSDIFQEFLSSLFEYIEEETKGFSNSEIVIKAIKSLEPSNMDKLDLLIEKIDSHEDDISEFAEFYDIDNDNPDYDFLVLLGFLRRCDYSSSGGVDIERGELKTVFDGLSETIEKNIAKDKTEIYLWQKDVLKTINSDKSLVLVAPTGSGKTEFALLWAEINKRKLIYTLPLRVALNDLFSRFRNSKDGYFNGEDVDILHSTAFIEYIKEEKEGNDLDIDKMMTSTQMISSPILLTTPDQVFLTSLNYYGSDKVISVYPFSSIVIDEIQTYNEEMAAIIIKTLEIIHKLKGKILIITATFPPYYENYFNELGEDGFKIIDVAKFDETTKSKIKNFNLKRHKIAVLEKSLFDSDLKLKKDSESELNKLIEDFKNENLFIILNNVKKAIKIYENLKNKGNIYLLHSRLIEKEKRRRIKEIKEKIEDKEKKEKVIVISTQIVEASVDLDFDAMITEISTIDSQIQRWGRVYRNRVVDYPEDKSNIIIFSGEKIEDEPLKVDRGTRAIYDYKVIEKTFEVLKEHKINSNALDYEDEREMIKEVFEKEINGVKLKEIYEKGIQKNLDYLNYFTVEKKSQAQRLFRTIAGVNAVIPNLMKYEKDDLNVKKEFAKILNNSENRKVSWKKIEEEILKLTGKKVNKWDLKKILYEYSVSIPIFYSEKNDFLDKITFPEFKGFYVLNQLTEDELKSIYECGIDSIFEKLENDEISELVDFEDDNIV
ncbi:CRISPR-associated helicase Cas3' [Methanobacterium sp. MBAC-LM]|uniref:CRISPR-associated helicase Cas3' n=1 Tax=Methanobacterium sp. MBAC-LM TaxID=3412034 RepID=UPI003C7913E9